MAEILKEAAKSAKSDAQTGSTAEKTLNVAFIGNPNCGKTTLFNAYTGANLKVANWPGVTVEKKEGSYRFQNQDFDLIDLPGIYSLTSYTMEERVSRQCILSDEVDVIIDVADASALERNLYLTLQLIELGKPVVMALNMMDIVEERGMEIDLHRMQEMLGIPVIPVSARKKTGLEQLMHAVLHHKDASAKHRIEHHHKVGENASLHEEYALVYSDEIEKKIASLEASLASKFPDLTNLRWYAIKYLENDGDVMKDYQVGFDPSEYESRMINEKYDFIEEVVAEVLVKRDEKSASTDRIDSVLTRNNGTCIRADLHGWRLAQRIFRDRTRISLGQRLVASHEYRRGRFHKIARCRRNHRRSRRNTDLPSEHRYPLLRAGDT